MRELTLDACQVDLVLAAWVTARALVDEHVASDTRLHGILRARVNVLFAPGSDFDRALEALVADAESAGGARRHVLMLVHDRIACPLWQLEISCAAPRP